MRPQGGFCAAPAGAQRAVRSDRDDALRSGSGIALLELHLERMKASAAELGFAFDRQPRNQIQALCFELEAPAKVRLLSRAAARPRSRPRRCARR